MKQRFITAGIGFVLFAVIMLFFDTLIFNAAISVLSILAAYELLNATKCAKNKTLFVVALLLAGIIPFLRIDVLKDYTIVILCFCALVIFTIMLFSRKKTTFEDVAKIVLISTFFPFALTSLIYMRDIYGYTKGIYYVMLVFAVSWGSDGGAYFVGRFLGKRKLAPDISPNKTIEGFVGGIFSSALIVSAYTGVFILYNNYVGQTFSVNWIGLIVFAMIGSVVSVLGDLTASLIKREFKIKDFGKIMPGHGGVVDRFDSVFFVSPFLLMVLSVLTV